LDNLLRAEPWKLHERPGPVDSQSSCKRRGHSTRLLSAAKFPDSANGPAASRKSLHANVTTCQSEPPDNRITVAATDHDHRPARLRRQIPAMDFDLSTGKTGYALRQTRASREILAGCVDAGDRLAALHQDQFVGPGREPPHCQKQAAGGYPWNPRSWTVNHGKILHRSTEEEHDQGGVSISSCNLAISFCSGR